MKYLGVIEKITKSRRLLLRMEAPLIRDPKEAPVLLKDGKFVGIVKDVIGPVHSPFLLVKPVIPLEEAQKLIGKKIYSVSRGEWRALSRKLKKNFS